MNTSVVKLVTISVFLFGSVGANAEPFITIPLDNSNDRLLITTPEGYQTAQYSFGAVPAHESDSNPHGLSIALSQGQALTVYGPVVDTGPGLCLIQCELYATGPDFILAAAALNVPAGTTLSDIDGSLATNQLVSGTDYVGAWKNMEVLYDPQGDAVAPVFQVIGTASTAVTLFVRRFVLTPLQNLPMEEAQEILRLHGPLSTPTIQPTSTPTPPGTLGPDSDALLWVSERKRIIQGEATPNVYHGGSNTIVTASSGNGYAVVYYDYFTDETNVHFFDSNQNPTTVSDSLGSQVYNYQIQWNGDVYVIVWNDARGLYVSRYLPTGEFESKSTLVSGQFDTLSSFVVEFDRDTIHLLYNLKTEDTILYHVADYSSTGEILCEPFTVTLRGRAQSATWFDGGFAVVSEVHIFIHNRFKVLQIFRKDGTFVCDPIDLSELVNALLPKTEIHWNGRNLVLLMGEINELYNGRITTFAYDLNGNQIHPPIEIGTFKVIGTLNFVNELI